MNKAVSNGFFMMSEQSHYAFLGGRCQSVIFITKSSYVFDARLPLYLLLMVGDKRAGGELF